MELELDLRGDTVVSLRVPETSKESVCVHHFFGDRVDLIEAILSSRRRRVATLKYSIRRNVAYISWMAVTTAYRNKGFAKLLLNRALLSFHHQGCREVRLFCYPVDPDVPKCTRLRALYERYGFYPVPDCRPSGGVARYLCFPRSEHAKDFKRRPLKVQSSIPL
jgi:GNAT superfamily N-acetyltransferase